MSRFSNLPKSVGQGIENPTVKGENEKVYVDHVKKKAEASTVTERKDRQNQYHCAKAFLSSPPAFYDVIISHIRLTYHDIY